MLLVLVLILINEDVVLLDADASAKTRLAVLNEKMTAVERNLRLEKLVVAVDGVMLTDVVHCLDTLKMQCARRYLQVSRNLLKYGVAL